MGSQSAWKRNTVSFDRLITFRTKQRRTKLIVPFQNQMARKSSAKADRCSFRKIASRPHYLPGVVQESDVAEIRHRLATKTSRIGSQCACASNFIRVLYCYLYTLHGGAAGRTTNRTPPDLTIGHQNGGGLFGGRLHALPKAPKTPFDPLAPPPTHHKRAYPLFYRVPARPTDGLACWS